MNDVSCLIIVIQQRLCLSVVYFDSVFHSCLRIISSLYQLSATFVTDAFSACVSASGSLWYPGFAEFAESHPFRSRPRSVYLSVGSREHRTPNPVMRTVNDCTSRILDRCVSEGVEAVFETNPGNHFRDGDLRLAKGIAWTLSR